MPKTIRLVKGQVPEQVHILVTATPDVQRRAAWHHCGADGPPHVVLDLSLAVPNIQVRRRGSTSIVPGACATRSAGRTRLGLW